ncbi:hypothetical protein CCACVL1_20766 [Corchorus capsularis]|uniref:Uncharacterized protein n=1 Tax=Corchorus capsularis TaxID=210143 RepID=A0A1R3H9Z7_COCAP|nr:hypothetical protein CCACVL1_20766 [Corchorus capsularis]
MAHGIFRLHVHAKNYNMGSIS